MVMRREKAPGRSPTSFSNGGGVWYGSSRRTSRSAWAFGFRPAAASFFASLLGLLGVEQPPAHQSSLSSSSSTGVAMPSRMDSRMPGSETRYSVSWTARQSSSRDQHRAAALAGDLDGFVRLRDLVDQLVELLASLCGA